jgi:hypothetical protein
VVQHQRRRWRYWTQSYNARFKECMWQSPCALQAGTT